MIVLFAYAFASNVALAIVPHEPVVIWYGAQVGIWTTAGIATAGTLVASWVDHRLFVPLLLRASDSRPLAHGPVGAMRRWFGRAPFAIITLSGVTPLPFWPFKALAFAGGYPMGRYLAAVAVGRFPRYLFLAWFGFAFRFPAWLLAAALVILALPSLRLLPWKRRPES